MEQRRDRIIKNLRARFKLWFSTKQTEGGFGDGKWRLLNEINNKGSLRAASEILGISYRKAWGDLKKAETLLGYDLTEKTRGGKEGGKSLLTPAALKLLEAYAALQQKLGDAVEEAYLELKNKMENQ